MVMILRPDGNSVACGSRSTRIFLRSGLTSPWLCVDYDANCGIARLMNSSKSGTVKAMSPYAGL
jgi:hypothetical protein